MHPSSNHRLKTGTNGRFALTRHARQRMASRRVRVEAVDAALKFGRVVYIRGADIYAIGRNEVELYAQEGIDLSPYAGTQVVVTSAGVVLTVYRNHDFRGLRARGTARRRDAA